MQFGVWPHRFLAPSLSNWVYEGSWVHEGVRPHRVPFSIPNSAAPPGDGPCATQSACTALTIMRNAAMFSVDFIPKGHSPIHLIFIEKPLGAIYSYAPMSGAEPPRRGAPAKSNASTIHSAATPLSCRGERERSEKS